MYSVLAFLKTSIEAGRLAHAYLFVGSEYIDKMAVVQKFVEILECDPLDYLFVEPARSAGGPEVIEKKEVKKVLEIGIDQIRNLQYRLSLSPFKSPYQIAVINRADKITKEAANALLKTLEEPSPKVILILITSSLNSILPTIQSRCQIIKFPAPPISVFKKPEFLGKYEAAIRELNNLIKSDLTVKYKYAETLSKDVSTLQEQLSLWLIAARDAILSKITVSLRDISRRETGNCQKFTISDNLISNNYSLNQLQKIFKKIKETNYLVSNSSINARLALEVLMLEL